MSDEELKQLWRQRELAPPLQLPDTELVARMKKKMGEFDRALLWRDGRELIACVFVFALFLRFFLQPHSALTGAGCIVVMLSCVFIGAELFFSRRKHPEPPQTAPLGDYVNAHLVRLKWQAKLLRMVWLWYLLPLFIGYELYELGQARGVLEQIFVFIFNVALFAAVYWLNLYAVRKGLLPLQQELEHTLDPENAPAPESNRKPGGLRFHIKLGNRTSEYAQKCPFLLRFCIAMNCFWLTVPLSMLRSVGIPLQTFPSVHAQATVVFVAILAWIFGARTISKTSFSWVKLWVLGFAAFAGLFALAWGTNILLLLLNH